MSTMNRQEIDGLIDYSHGFVSNVLASRISKPECLTSEQVLQECIQSLVEQGVLLESSVKEMAIWRIDPEQQSQPGEFHYFSCKLLQSLGRINSALAYEVHQKALIGYIASVLGDQSEAFASQMTQFSLSLFGHYGLGRFSLARYLIGVSREIDLQDLKDYYLNSRDHIRTYTLGSWTKVIHPYLDQSGILQLRIYPKELLNVELEQSAHGLKELDCNVIAFNKATGKEIVSSTFDAEESRHFFAQLIQMYWLGVLSISSGQLSGAYDAALEFSSQRKQGGVMIRQHPAIRLLLSQVQTVLSQSESGLESIRTKTLNEYSLRDIAALRALMQPAICDAANKALQVYGGMGYMRDVGAEKTVRDCMQLNLMGGTSMDLSLFISALEEIA